MARTKKPTTKKKKSPRGGTKMGSKARKKASLTSKKVPKARAKSIKQRVKVRPGFIVVDTSTASGGVTYVREYDDPTPINNGQGLRTKLHTTKTVDNVDAVAALDALKKKADYACKKHCARTAFGWFADEVSLRALRREIAELRIEAQALNVAAAARGSERRVHIGIVAGELDVANVDTAREIARTIREVLVNVYNALRTGHVKKVVDKDGETVYKDELHAPLLKCKNLDRIAVGRAGDAVAIALERIPEAKKEVLERLKEGEEPAEIGADLDLGAIENAITWFEDDEIGAGSGATSDPVSEALKL
jgi:hypothetical protein